jgi:hypothetical protein
MISKGLPSSSITDLDIRFSDLTSDEKLTELLVYVAHSNVKRLELIDMRTRKLMLSSY